jgi:putative ABC transport system permease protein
MRPEHWLYTIPLRLRSLFRRAQADQELDDELCDHLERKTEEYVAQGMTHEEARRRARLDLAGIEQTKERCRDARRMNWIQDLTQDTRYGFRMLRKNPGFTTVAVLTLALGIGANTAIFSVVNGVLLRPLAYKDSDRLVQLIGHDQKRGVDFDWVSFANFHDWAEQSKSFQYMAAYKFHVFNLTNVSQAQVLFGIKVSASLLPTLGAEPILGRNFRAEEDEPGRDHEVILIYDTWRQLFGANPQIIGKTLTLNDELCTVIGVMPVSFNFPPTVPVTSSLPSRKTQFLTPLGLAFNSGQRDWNMLGVIARLKPDATIEQARADISTVAHNLELQYPAQNGGVTVRVEPLLNQVVGDVRSALWIFLAAISLVLLVACANVTSLLLARSTIRQKEMALRASLGASRSRLVQQLLTESLLLALASGTLGIMLAYAGTLLLPHFSPDNLPRLGDVAIDGRVLAYTFVVSIVTGVIFGVAPSWGSSRVDVSQPLKTQGTTSTASERHSRLRSALVVSEVAVSLALLIGASLMLKSFVRLERVDPGFRADKLLTIWTVLSERKYAPQQRAAFYQQVWERIRRLPGVKSVGAIDDLPLSGIHGGGPFTIEGHPTESDNDAPNAYRCTVNVDYFKAMGIPLLQGREFTDRDREGAPTVLIVNETAARRYWPGQNPVGTRLSFTTGRMQPTWLEIVGVVKDVLHDGLDLPPKPTIYLPFLQNPPDFVVTAVRTDIDPAALTSAVREVMGAVDKDQPILMTRTMTEIFSDAVAQRRFNTVLIVAFGAIALLLAMVGVYGLMAYTVMQRTHELGVRIALGAERWDVMKLVLGRGLRLTVIGIGFGLTMAFVLARFLSKMLFNVRQTDSATFVVVSLCLGGIALLASYVPARRAMKVDPMVALRYE